MDFSHCLFLSMVQRVKVYYIKYGKIMLRMKHRVTRNQYHESLIIYIYDDHLGDLYFICNNDNYHLYYFCITLVYLIQNSNQTNCTYSYALLKAGRKRNCFTQYSYSTCQLFRRVHMINKLLLKQIACPAASMTF